MKRQHGLLFGVIWEVMAIDTIDPTEDPGHHSRYDHE